MRDVRYAARMFLARSPGFTAAAAASLALGSAPTLRCTASCMQSCSARSKCASRIESCASMRTNLSLNRPTFSAPCRILSWKEQAHSLDLAAFQGYSIS